MRRLLPVLMVIAACSSTPPATTSTIDVIDELDRPPCPTAGEILTEDVAVNGCMDGDTLVFLGINACDDGRQLWGEDNMWAWVGDVVIETSGDSASDSEFAAAYAECYP